MLLSEYRPHSALVTKTTLIDHPRFPVVDCHNHLTNMFGYGWDDRSVTELLDKLDQANVRVYVDLDGGFGKDILEHHLRHFKSAAPDRFCVFGGFDWNQWGEKGDGFIDWAVSEMRQQATQGIQGFKFWKNLGLRVRDHRGTLVAVNDPRLDPVWATAGELGLPITIHVADPVAFFWPLDEHNERWEELSEHLDWHFPSPPYPSHLSIVEGLADIAARHPQTTFIGAHVASYSENLAWVSQVMDRCPNFYVDISARINELGRQPYSSRQFFLKYADRILFGTDMGPNLDFYRIYYRFLETDDEFFGYDPGDLPSQGRWGICGIFLPEDVLKKVYYQNAERIILKGKLV